MCYAWSIHLDYFTATKWYGQDNMEKQSRVKPQDSFGFRVHVGIDIGGTLKLFFVNPLYSESYITRA
jgi:hypothetical protein